MNRVIYILLLVTGIGTATAQPFKFYYSNVPKVLKQNNDTMLYPFTGGLNAPQFSKIDLNNDGFKDLVVFDRAAAQYGHKLMTFLWSVNKFVYAPQYEIKFPEMYEWVSLIDYNGDGKEDIFTEVSREKSHLIDTSVLPYPNGLRVFINKSDASGLKFKLISNQLRDTGGWWKDFNLPRVPGSVSFNKTDINGLEDIDGDGDLDIIGYNGFDFSPHYYENWTINPQNIPYNHDSLIFIYRDDCWGYIQYDVNAQRNQFKLRQSKDSLSSCAYQLYPKKKHAGSTSLLIDLNNDGIKDVVYGDVSFKSLISLTNGRKQNSLHRDSISSQDTLFPSGTTRANFIIEPAAYYLDIDNDNVNELLVTTNDPANAKSTNNVWVYENNRTTAFPLFNYQGNNFFVNNESIDLGTRSVPVLVDIDKDGDKDLIVATNGDYENYFNYSDRLILFKNISSDASKPVFMLADTNFLLLSKDTAIVNIHPAFGDLNGDGKEDLIVGERWGNLLYYINNSTSSVYSFQLNTRRFANINVPTYAAPQLIDMNKDGLLDMVIGNKTGTVQYFQNTGTVNVPQFSSVPTIDNFGAVSVNKITILPQGYIDSAATGYSTPHVCDLDNDGKFEMMVGCEAGYIFMYTDVSLTPSAKFTKYENLFVSDSSSQSTFKLTFGARTAPFTGFLDGDSKPDLIFGNMRGGLNLFGSTKRENGSAGTSFAEVARKVIVYPNPAAHYFTIGTENMEEDLKFAVYNEIGKLMEDGRMSKYLSEQKINCEGYSSGMYFIVFKGDNGYSGAKRILISK